MQMGRQYIPYAATFDHIFSKSMKKNRVELASDFPAQNEAEVISSLQIHPQGWCALSRNISYDESSEWTCVHDIQEWEVDDDDEEDKFEDDDQTHRDCSSGESDSDGLDRAAVRRAKKARLSKTTSRTRRNPRSSPQPAAPTPVVAPDSPIVPDIWAAELTVRDRVQGNRHINTNRASGNAHIYGISSGVVGLSLPEEDEERSPNEPIRAASYSKPTNSTANKPKIPQNMRRMLKYIEEPNKGKGFIKELCFSSDGRIICSPYGCGIRLLSFSPDCSELPNTLNPNGEAQPLVPLKYVKCHSDIVVSTKFSPRQPLFASGCLHGKVVWHQPNF